MQRGRTTVLLVPDVDIPELEAYCECDFGKRKAGPAWVHARGGFREPTSPKKGYGSGAKLEADNAFGTGSGLDPFEELPSYLPLTANQCRCYPKR